MYANLFLTWIFMIFLEGKVGHLVLEGKVGQPVQNLLQVTHTCGKCGMKFLSDEKVHLHHIDDNHDNWKPKNLLAIHESCHDYIHMSKKS